MSLHRQKTLIDKIEGRIEQSRSSGRAVYRYQFVGGRWKKFLIANDVDDYDHQSSSDYVDDSYDNAGDDDYWLIH